MKAHISDKEEVLHKALQDNFRKVRQAGLINGAAAIADVILKMAQEEDVTEHDRLEKIIEFCQKSLRLKGEHDNAK